MYRMNGAVYPHLPLAMRLLEHTVPARWQQRLHPDIGGLPPDEVLDRFPNYRADAAAFRLQARWIRERAFETTADTLHRFVADRIEVDIDALRGWMNGPTGAIFACPHYGPFVGAAMLLAAEGSEERPANVFYDAPGDVPHNERFDLLFERFTSTLKVLHNHPKDLIKAARALRAQQCISIMFDVVQRPMDCMYVPFFGRLYPAMGGAAALSLLSKAPIVPAYAVPLPDRRLRIVFGQVINPGNYSDQEREQGIFAMTCALFKDLERQLTAQPWHWIYWGNVQHSPRPDVGAVTDVQSLREELGRRLAATPQLLKLAPALRELVDAS